MRIGVFADVHDHVDNLRHAINVFNEARCELVLFAGDLVSPLVVPPLRKLTAKLVACWGDNDGNRIGIAGGFRICGTMGEPPIGITARDGTRILLTHELDKVRGLVDDAQLIVFAHSHRPSVAFDKQGRLFLNPGETSGWNFRKPTVAIVETDPLNAEIVSLPEMPPAVVIEVD